MNLFLCLGYGVYIAIKIHLWEKHEIKVAKIQCVHHGRKLLEGEYRCERPSQRSKMHLDHRGVTQDFSQNLGFSAEHGA